MSNATLRTNATGEVRGVDATQASQDDGLLHHHASRRVVLVTRTDSSRDSPVGEGMPSACPHDIVGPFLVAKSRSRLVLHRRNALEGGMELMYDQPHNNAPSSPCQCAAARPSSGILSRTDHSLFLLLIPLFVQPVSSVRCQPASRVVVPFRLLRCCYIHRRCCAALDACFVRRVLLLLGPGLQLLSTSIFPRNASSASSLTTSYLNLVLHTQRS